MSVRNKFLILLGVILTIASGYYFFPRRGGMIWFWWGRWMRTRSW